MWVLFLGKKDSGRLLGWSDPTTVANGVGAHAKLYSRNAGTPLARNLACTTELKGDE
jgi:hypothetical protein